MDQIISSLVQAGGMGALAAVLLWLHSKSIERFSQEQKATIDRFDLVQQRTLDRFDSIMARTMDAYKAEIANERSTCMAQHEKNMDAHKETRHNLADIEGAISTQTAVIRTAMKLPEPPSRV